MEDDNPEDLYGSQEVARESEDRSPLKVVDLTAETEVQTDRAEEEPAPENVEPLPVHEPLREIDPSAGHQVSGQRCIRSLGRIKKTAPYLLQTGMRRVQDTCNPGRQRCYPRPTAIQTSALVFSESSDEESSDSDATWGWCSDSNDQGRAEQVARSQVIVRLGEGPSDQPGVRSRGGPKALGRSSSAGL